jgi:demethylmenaquinone methyltransferase/2-methoxy-6-polyprenyl-1,4-benzoquinol methylase
VLKNTIYSQNDAVRKDSIVLANTRREMMRELLFNGTSQTNRFVFKQLLNALESRFRYRFNDPVRLVEASGVQTGQTVLEIGCGSGFFTPALSDIVDEQGVVHAIDYHPMGVEATRQKMRQQGRQNVHVSRADAHETDFPDASFDTIVLFGVVPAPVISEKRLAVEMHRILKPGGIVAVWTLAPFWSPRTIMKAAPFTRCDTQRRVYRLQKPGA